MERRRASLHAKAHKQAFSTAAPIIMAQLPAVAPVTPSASRICSDTDDKTELFASAHKLANIYRASEHKAVVPERHGALAATMSLDKKFALAAQDDNAVCFRNQSLLRPTLTADVCSFHRRAPRRSLRLGISLRPVQCQRI